MITVIVYNELYLTSGPPALTLLPDITELDVLISNSDCGPSGKRYATDKFMYINFTTNKYFGTSCYGPTGIFGWIPDEYGCVSGTYYSGLPSNTFVEDLDYGYGYYGIRLTKDYDPDGTKTDAQIAALFKSGLEPMPCDGGMFEMSRRSRRR